MPSIAQGMLSVLGTMHTIVQTRSLALQITGLLSCLGHDLCHARKMQYPQARAQLHVGNSHVENPANAFHQIVQAMTSLTAKLVLHTVIDKISATKQATLSGS